MPGDIHSMKHWKLSKMRTPECPPVIFQVKPCARTGRKKRRARSIEASRIGTASTPVGVLDCVFDCRMANDPATINKESTNENNTDVDRWADARRLLRINGYPLKRIGTNPLFNFY
jgi:hypothetical protein